VANFEGWEITPSVLAPWRLPIGPTCSTCKPSTPECHRLFLRNIQLPFAQVLEIYIPAFPAWVCLGSIYDLGDAISFQREAPHILVSNDLAARVAHFCPSPENVDLAHQLKRLGQVDRRLRRFHTSGTTLTQALEDCTQ
jgi:hypothetical protein